MSALSSEQLKELDLACKRLIKEEKEVFHAGVINQLGNLIAGGFKNEKDPIFNKESMKVTYMQMQLDFNMRQEMDEVLGPIDYIASRREKQLVISVPIGKNIVLITAEPTADDKKIIKKAEELFDSINIMTIKK
ncbi:hypothetical protein NsoK4_04630 [Nitrosopumilus sp. K4]|uniref:DUF6659 family protein n=1 Tax=Nitrosopumilus sp. K4 TaxID=2795383 RepID=UPI001BA7E2AD|nr:DUF6659 family protein [Nitrosopumilus sp. K4]QUC65527.1 hypothetical protein NsoK4_04630 [Nitrosopumilus sp. K4]